MSGVSWKLISFASKIAVQSALLTHDGLEEWDYELVVSGTEIAEDRPDEWVLEAWYPYEPGEAQITAIAGLFSGIAPKPIIEKLEDQDWLTLSQEGVDPIHAGRFCVHTREHAPDPDAVNLMIPASQAFGTGQHETTAGCLTMLEQINAAGIAPRNIADIGTGTGLLAFAAMKLWPNAFATASDIDAVCAGVVEENAADNSIPMGHNPGELALVIADGMDHEILAARGPYDLLIANILAGPLIELAPSFSNAVTPDGHVVLAGLLETQDNRVLDAYIANGFSFSARLINGDWSILWLKKNP